MQSYHLYVGQLKSLSLSLFIYLFILKKHVYVQVVVIVVHIFPWFYIQERLKRPLWVGDRFPIQFSKKLANMVIFSQIPKTMSSMFFMELWP
jgi:dolichol kinase